MKGDKFLVMDNEKAPEEIRGKVVVEQYRLKYCTCVKSCRGGYYKVANSCLRPRTRVRNYIGYLCALENDETTGTSATLMIPQRNKFEYCMFLDLSENEIEVLSEPV